MKMLDDGHEDLFGGIWPFIKRALLVFLPIWVGLIVWTGGHGYIDNTPLMFMSTIAAGLSLPLIQLFEKYNLHRNTKSEPDSDNVIK